MLYIKDYQSLDRHAAARSGENWIRAASVFLMGKRITVHITGGAGPFTGVLTDVSRDGIRLFPTASPTQNVRRNRTCSECRIPLEHIVAICYPFA